MGNRASHPRAYNSRARFVAPAVLILHVYVLRQILRSLLFGVAGVLVLAVPGIAISTVHRLPNPDVALLAAYLPVVFQTLAPYLLPLCFLLAVVATYGRLASDREWTAIQIAGFHPLRVLVPGLLIALGLTGLTWWLLGTQVPRLKAQETEMQVAAAERVLSSLDPGRTTIHHGDFFVNAKWRDPRDPDYWYEVYIRIPKTDEVEGGEESSTNIFADRMHMWTEDGVVRIDLEGWSAVQPGDTSHRMRVGTVQLSIPLEELIEPRKWRRTKPRYLTNGQIRERLRRSDLKDGERDKLRFEFHKRSALSVVYLLFLALGAPTGLILRRGTQLGALAIASAFGILYYVLSMNLGRQLATSGMLPGWIAAWSANLIGGALSIPLMRRGLRR